MQIADEYLFHIASPPKSKVIERGRSEGDWCTTGIGRYSSRASGFCNFWTSDQLHESIFQK